MDSEKKYKTAEECGINAFNNGYEFFVFSKIPGQTTSSCKGCKAGSQM